MRLGISVIVHSIIMIGAIQATESGTIPPIWMATVLGLCFGCIARDGLAGR